ncbi:MAG: helix-turn-helix transcriptional regulator [Thermomicrobiales bacterium]
MSAREEAGRDERALLLLGVLMVQSQHGYQINDFIERALCDVTTMKKPTAYALLDRLAAAGHISVHAEQEGNRPPRKVYTITPSGRSLFLVLLRENLAAVDQPTFAGDIGLMLLRYLPLEEALACLRQRLASLDAQLARQTRVPPHGEQLTIDLALEHLAVLRHAERDWLAGVIDRLAAEQALSTQVQPAEV